MAKILFSARSNIIWDKDNPLAIDAFYEAFIQELAKAGNEVLFVRANGNINDFIWNKKDFNPDIIIAANNEIPLSILRQTTCPVILWNSDSPAYYLHPDYIRENVERYFFANHGWGGSFVKACCQMYGCKEEQHFSVGYATSVKAEKKTIKQNIVFMGTIGWCTGAIQDFQKIKSQEEYNDFISNFTIKTQNVKEFEAKYLYVVTSNQRIKTLDALSDLGLNCYGWAANFSFALPYSIDLIKCFNPTPMYKLQDIQDEFNASLIAPTLPNAQAITGCSWRVADVMASNACLISPPKPDLQKISPYVKIPTFESPTEARELCQRLLKDDVWRSDIVAGCQKAIDENCRFINIFQRIESIIPVSLIASPVSVNEPTFIVLSERKNKSVKKSRIKKKVELIFYAFLFLLSLLPLSGSFLKKKRILKKINKTMKK